jgi:hypothetical protein
MTPLFFVLSSPRIDHLFTLATNESESVGLGTVEERRFRGDNYGIRRVKLSRCR